MISEINTNPNNTSWFSSEQAGTPVIASGQNDLLQVLDACLVTGYGEKTAVSASIDGNNVVINFGMSHGFMQGQVVSVTGATDSLLNGKHKIRALTNNTITIEVVGVLNVSGDLVVGVAPLGWSSLLGNSNPLKRAYKSSKPNSSGDILHLDMSYGDPSIYHATTPARRASLSICKEISESGEMIGEVTEVVNNRTVSKNGSLFWYQKRHPLVAQAVTSSGSAPWVVVGNSDFFYIALGWSDGNYQNSGSNPYGSKARDVYGFGDYISLDASLGLPASFLMASHYVNDALSATGISGGPFTGYFGARRAINSAHAIVSLFQGGEKINYNAMPFDLQGASTVTSGAGGINFPNTYGDVLFTQPHRLSKTGSVLGFLPSLVFIENSIGTGYDQRVFGDTLVVNVMNAGAPSAYIMSCVGFNLGD